MATEVGEFSSPSGVFDPGVAAARKLDDLKSSIADLTGVEPKSIASDRDAREASIWVDMQKKTEAEAEALLGPAIKKAFTEHKKLTGEKKSLLDKLIASKDRVRAGLANWIGAGHAVAGCYVKTKYRVTVNDMSQLPDEYKMTVADMDELEKWATLTEGKQKVPGCTIVPVHILYAKEQE